MNSTGFISFPTLAGDADNVRAKLATIWFDHLILQIPRGRETMEGILQGIFNRGEITRDAMTDLQKCWRPIDEVLPNYDGVLRISNPWGDHNKHLVSSAERLVTDEIRDRFPTLEKELPGGFQYEIARTGAALIWSVRDWADLNQMAPCSYVADDLESKIAQEAFRDLGPRDGEAFASVATIRIPDLSLLSWDRVVELRHHPHLSAFRKHLAAIQQQLWNVPSEDFHDVVARLELDALREFAVAAKPSTRASVIKGFVSNIPMPIPVNPASLAIAANDIARDAKLTRRFGWLYFLLDLAPHR